MRTLIINGSPNGRKGNSEIFCRRFIQGMQNQPEIRYAAEEDPAALAADMDGYDHWLFFFPLYVNAMSGILKRLFEHLNPSEEKRSGMLFSPVLKKRSNRTGSVLFCKILTEEWVTAIVELS